MGEALVAVPWVNDRHHPLAAAYRTACLPVIDRLLGCDRLRPIFLFDEVPTRVMEATALSDVDPELQSLRNLNTPEDYADALREYQADMV
jgi:molybdopterin-guanine dinucleotide biosynthesis protein A